jgi:DNA repair photolyase
MYDWTTHVHNHLEGRCGHCCNYCYVQQNPHGVSPKYEGPARLNERELEIAYGEKKTIFIEHMNDIFGPGILTPWIKRILDHCRDWPNNRYVFQSKNPAGYFSVAADFPISTLFGTTIETNWPMDRYSKAPAPRERAEALLKIKLHRRDKVFITIEPIMEFDLDILMGWIEEIQPEFVNIGADSKGCRLPEPSGQKIWMFIKELMKAGIQIKKKNNLGRLLEET